MSTPDSNNVILLVDDQPIVARAVLAMVEDEPDLELHYCQEASRALALAAEVRPTVILLDLVMPDTDGLTLLVTFQRDPLLAGVPVIVLSTREDPRVKSEAFALGASDYLVKLPDKIELLARVRAHGRSYLARRQRDDAYRVLEELKRQLEEQNVVLQRMSRLDGLTGIANRRHFDDALELAWRRAARDGSALALILVDVDYFKLYNDCYGHVQGDECLRQVAWALSDSTRRSGDLAARYGGEEFALILTGIEEEASPLGVVETLRERVLALAIPHARSTAAPVVSISSGLAVVRPGRELRIQALIAAADGALYAAKQAGRNRYAAARTV